MEKTMKPTISSFLYRKIDELGLTGGTRSEAIGALQTVDRMAGRVFWLFEKLGQLKRCFAPNPKLKHQ